MPELSAELTLGDFTINQLCDAITSRKLGEFFQGIDPSEWMPVVGATDPEVEIPFTFSAFLVRDGRRTILIDTGVGEGVLDDTAIEREGLLDRLAELGIGPEDIDLILHTHLHYDHVGWNIVGKAEEARAFFPNATVMVAQSELDYWFHPVFNGRGLAAVPRGGIAPYGDAGRLEAFNGEQVVSQGITAVPTYGHTPGHAAYMLSSQGKHLLVLGDLAHQPVMLERHHWVTRFDVDPGGTTRARAGVCELALQNDALITSHHFPVLTLVHVRKEGGEYRCDRVEG